MRKIKYVGVLINAISFNPEIKVRIINDDNSIILISEPYTETTLDPYCRHFVDNILKKNNQPILIDEEFVYFNRELWSNKIINNNIKEDKTSVIDLKALSGILKD